MVKKLHQCKCLGFVNMNVLHGSGLLCHQSGYLEFYVGHDCCHLGHVNVAHFTVLLFCVGHGWILFEIVSSYEI